MTFYRMYSLLFESPYVMDGEYRPSIEDDDINKKYCTSLLNDQYKFLEVFDNYNVWLSKGMSGDNYIFTDDKNCVIHAQIYLKTGVNETRTIWKRRESEKGLMLKLFIKYLIPKYGFISSSGEQFIKGKNFWIGLIKYAIENKYNVVIINPDMSETVLTINTFENSKDYIWKDSRIKLKIYAK